MVKMLLNGEHRHSRQNLIVPMNTADEYIRKHGNDHAAPFIHKQDSNSPYAHSSQALAGLGAAVGYAALARVQSRGARSIWAICLSRATNAAR
jgi:hypothetical protein